MTSWVLAGLVATVVAATIPLMVSFAPATLELPTVDVGKLPPASPTGMSISKLPTGTYQSPAALTYRGGSWKDTPVFALIVDGMDLLVIDQ